MFSPANWHQVPGFCNVCGKRVVFFYESASLRREQLICSHCGAISRYRSIARGLLKAIQELTGVQAASVKALARARSRQPLRVYDTQVPFKFFRVAYTLPKLLAKARWVELFTSRYDENLPPGYVLGPNCSNENLEQLTFPDDFFDIILTSDVMEHVRLADRAHAEIKRVLRPGGFYIFTVPFLSDQYETRTLIQVRDPHNPFDDVVLRADFHEDGNAPGGRVAVYREYGLQLLYELEALGFTANLYMTDHPELGIFNTELFYCRAGK